MISLREIQFETLHVKIWCTVRAASSNAMVSAAETVTVASRKVPCAINGSYLSSSPLGLPWTKFKSQSQISNQVGLNKAPITELNAQFSKSLGV